MARQEYGIKSMYDQIFPWKIVNNSLRHLSVTVSIKKCCCIRRLNATSEAYEFYQNLNVVAGTMVKTFTVGIYHYLAFATYNQEVIIFKVSSAIWKFAIVRDVFTTLSNI